MTVTCLITFFKCPRSWTTLAQGPMIIIALMHVHVVKLIFVIVFIYATQ